MPLDRPGLAKTSGAPLADAARQHVPPAGGDPHSRAAECPESRALSPLRGGAIPRTLSPARTSARLSTVRALRRSSPRSFATIVPFRRCAPPVQHRQTIGRGYDVSVLDLVCSEAGPRRTVVVDGWQRVDVLDVPWREVRA